MKRRRRWLVGIGALAALLTLNAALWLAQGGLALPGSLAQYFFGPHLVRAEVILKDGGVLHDFRLDRGRVRAVTSSSLTLFERDGTLQTIPVATNATVRLDGAPSSLSALSRGMRALTIRDGDAPAQSVQVTTR